MSGIMISSFIVLAVTLLAGVPAMFAFFFAVLILALTGGVDVAELASYGFLEISSIILLTIPLMIFVKAIMKRCGVVEMVDGYARSRIMMGLEDQEDTSGIWKSFVSNASMASIIVPPGIVLFLYAFASGQSIAACFAACILPAGILFCLLIVVSKVMADRKLKAVEKATEEAAARAEQETAEAAETFGMSEAEEPAEFAETADSAETAEFTEIADPEGIPEEGEIDGEERDCSDDEDGYEEEDDEDEDDDDEERSFVPAVIAPVLILIGTFSGLITLMEATAVAVIYIVIVGWFFYQELDMEELKDVLIETASKAGNILLTLFSAMLLSRFMIMEGVPQIVADGLSSMSESREVVVFFLILLMIIAGLLADRTSAVLLVAPVIVQIAIIMGINPIQFAVIAVLSLGLSRIITSRPTKTNLLFVLLAWLPTLLLTAFIPQISLFLPMLMGYL